MKVGKIYVEKIAKEILTVRKKLFILDFISKSKRNFRAECLVYDIPRNSYYNWKKKYQAEGEAGLRRMKPVAKHHPHQMPQ